MLKIFKIYTAHIILRQNFGSIQAEASYIEITSLKSKQICKKYNSLKKSYGIVAEKSSVKKAVFDSARN